MQNKLIKLRDDSKVNSYRKVCVANENPTLHPRNTNQKNKYIVSLKT